MRIGAALPNGAFRTDRLDPQYKQLIKLVMVSIIFMSILFVFIKQFGFQTTASIIAISFVVFLFLWKPDYRLSILVMGTSLSAEHIGINVKFISFDHIIVLLIMAFWMVDSLISVRRRIYWNNAFWGLVLLNAINFMSITKAIQLRYWLQMTVDFLNSSMICFLICQIAVNPKTVSRILISAVGTGMVVALIGIIQFVFLGQWRAYSIIGLNQGNTLAGYLMLIIPITLAGYYSFAEKRIKTISLIASIIQIICLIMTQSRGGVTALIAVFILFIVVTFRQDIKKIIKISIVWLLVGIGVWVLSSFLFPIFLKMIKLRVNTVSVNDVAMWTRFQLYYSAINMFKSNPIWGIGLGNFFFSYPKYGAIATLPGLWSSAHNIYLHILAEQGIIGFILFYGIIVYCLIKLFRIIKMAKQATQRWWYLGLIGSIVSVMVHGLVDSLFQFRPFSFMLWSLIGLSFALFKLQSGNATILKIKD